jgi:large subunit ribosomal protein L21
VGDLEGGPKIGQPVVDGAKVKATVLGEIKGDKIIIQKFRRRKGYSLKKGHRQRHLQVKVDKIEV